jgi:hypothetical protein
MVLDGADDREVLGEVVGAQGNLIRNEADDFGGDVLGGSRETTDVLDGLEHDGKAEARVLLLFREKPELTGQEGKVGVEVGGVP